MKKQTLFAALILVATSAWSQFVPAEVLAVYPHRELINVEQMQCHPRNEYHHEQNPSPGYGDRYNNVRIGIRHEDRRGSVSVQINNRSVDRPRHNFYRDNSVCELVTVRTMGVVGFKVTVRMPTGQNRLIHTQFEPSVGSILYTHY